MGMILIVIIIIIVLITGNSGSERVEDESFQINDTELNDLLGKNDSETDVFNELEGTPVKKDNKVDENGLCEDYFFEQGDELEIAEHTIIVEKIAQSSLRLIVDDKRLVFGEGETERLGDGIRVELQENNVAYFGVDDPNNSASLRIGCDHDENPISKLVDQEGQKVCRALYDQCKESFDYSND
ncbi:MAG: hypothetical protein ACQESE_05065 [Nanobdellota archaeon]